MFKLAVFFALMAATFAAPQYLVGSPLASPYLSSYSALAYNGYNAAAYSPYVYNAPAAVAPVAYSAPAVSIPAPYAYQTAPQVSYAAEPVEQHGYKIAY